MKIVVPYASGGPTDAVARVVADPLSKAWGQQVVIENKGGAGTNIGTEMVARAEPDGYTVLVGSSALAMNRALYPTLSYDAVADFAPVSLLVSFAFYMCVPNSSPAKSVQGVHRLRQGEEGQADLCDARSRHAAAHGGRTAQAHGRNRDDPRALSRRGAGLQRLIPGRVDMMFASGVVLDLIKAGQMRGLAISGAKRVAVAPDIPTVAEAGVPGFDVSSWFALLRSARRRRPTSCGR